MESRYSLRSPAVKRLMKEAQELREPTEQYFAQPLDDNLFEWHFTIRGPIDSEFHDGIYHGRIILPPDYPMKPPSIILLTPNGRFETHAKICLSISGHHPESWQPSWSIRTALLAIIGFMPTHGSGAIGSLNYSSDERKALARKSREFDCPHCGSLKNTLLPRTDASKATSEEAKELAQQINFQGEKEKKEAIEKEKKAPSKSDTDSGDTTPAGNNSHPAGVNMPPPFAMQNPQAFFGRFPVPPMGFPPFPPPPGGQYPNPAGTQLPQGFMPPFCPPNIANPNGQPQRFGAMPNMMWPPGFMPPGRFPTSPACNVTSVTSSKTVVSATVHDSSSTTSESASTTSLQTAQSTSSESSQSNASPVSSGDKSEDASSNVPESTATTTESPQTGDSTVGPNHSDEGIRRRQTETTTTESHESRSDVRRSTSSPRIDTTHQPAELLRERQRRSDSSFLTLMMVLVGLALVILILRRLVLLNDIHFSDIF